MMFKKFLLLSLALTGACAFGVLGGIAGAAISSWLWPALNESTFKPPPDLAGIFIPSDLTRDFLKENYPGTDAWLDFHNDGTFEFHQIPGTRLVDASKVKNESGKWSLKNQGDRLWLLFDEEGDTVSYRLYGESPHIYIRFWDSAYSRYLLFARAPDVAIPGREFSQLSVTDYAIQGFGFLFVLLFPFCLPRGSGVRAIAYPFGFALAWGTWRMLYFDGVTENDIPGMGYLISAIFSGGFCGLVYFFRQSWISSRIPGAVITTSGQA